ncbi:DUF6691 family protein [Planctomycetota bacterium]
MSTEAIGFIIGALFGAGLFLGGLADPDKIIGTLRLKDFHALRTIAVFVLVGMLGTWILGLCGQAHYSVKPAAMISVAIGGAILGVGFGLTGYCPGTGLACAASGRIDALVTVAGMFMGALVFILIYPGIVQPIDAIANFKKVTLPEFTNTVPGFWVVPIVTVGLVTLILTRRK